MAGQTPGAMTRRRRPVALLLTILLGAPLVLLLTWPQAVGAQQLMLVSQAISFRGPLAIAGVVLAVVFGTAAALRRRAGVAAGLAVILVALAAGNAGVLLARGSGAPAADGEVTVLAWNTLGGAVAPEDIADLVLATGADIVSLPETDERAVAAVARLVRTGGREMSAATAYGATGDSRYPTSVLVSEELGEYRIDPSAGSTPDLPSAVLRPVDGDGPAIVAVHPLPPLPFTMGPWRGGLRWIAEACDGPDVIVAGGLQRDRRPLRRAGRRGRRPRALPGCRSIRRRCRTGHLAGVRPVLAGCPDRPRPRRLGMVGARFRGRHVRRCRGQRPPTGAGPARAPVGPARPASGGARPEACGCRQSDGSGGAASASR